MLIIRLETYFYLNTLFDHSPYCYKETTSEDERNTDQTGVV